MKDELLRRIADRVAPAPDLLDLASLVPMASDYDLNAHLNLDRRDRADLKPAAVLVPLIDTPEGLSILLTLRAAHLKSHAGQVSFPGGRLEPHDPTPIEAALREAEEEVGLARDRVEVLGLLDPYETVTGYCVMPVVGLIQGPFEPLIDPGEVAQAFEVPAAFLMDPTNHQCHEVEWQGQLRCYYAIPFGEHYIWGATAAMLVAFYKRLFEEC